MDHSIFHTILKRKSLASNRVGKTLKISFVSGSKPWDNLVLV